MASHSKRPRILRREKRVSGLCPDGFRRAEGKSERFRRGLRRGGAGHRAFVIETHSYADDIAFFLCKMIGSASSML